MVKYWQIRYQFENQLLLTYCLPQLTENDFGLNYPIRILL